MHRRTALVSLSRRRTDAQTLSFCLARARLTRARLSISTLRPYSTSEPRARAADLPYAVEHIHSLLLTHAPIDGILGMGQGGNLAQVIAAHAAAAQSRGQVDEGYGSLKFSVHLCGCRPGWQHQMRDIFAQPIAMPAFVAGGQNDVHDGELADSGFGMAQLVHPAVAMRYVHIE